VGDFLTILFLAFLQNISFTLVSRSRNRDNIYYHITCSLFSNGIWFLTMRELVVSQLTLWLAIPYVVGTVTGSAVGQTVSMKIEKLIGAKT
jgi:uncharacterized membrane protein YfcA